MDGESPPLLTWFFVSSGNARPGLNWVWTIAPARARARLEDGGLRCVKPRLDASRTGEGKCVAVRLPDGWHSETTDNSCDTRVYDKDGKLMFATWSKRFMRDVDCRLTNADCLREN